MRIGLVVCLSIGVLALSAPRVRAAGINLYWNDCSPLRGGAGVTGLTNDCTSNTGSLSLVASFVPPPEVTALLAAVVSVYVTLPAPSAPSWWQMQTGGCRAGSISAAFQFTGRSACTNPWPSSTLGFAQLDYPGCCNDPRLAWIRAVAAVPTEDSIAMSPNLEYYAFEILIDRRKSVGAGSCDGCATPACIELKYIELDQSVPWSYDQRLWQADQNTFVTYNGAHAGDCRYTPVRNRTWGAVKSMYR